MTTPLDDLPTNTDFVDLGSSRKVKRNNKRHEKKYKRYIKKINREPNKQIRKDLHKYIKNNLIPVVALSLKNTNSITDGIIQKKFYIESSRTFNDLKTIVEERINQTRKKKIYIQLYVYNSDNQLKTFKDETLMTTIYKNYKEDDGFIHIYYTVLGENFELINL